MEDRIPTLKIAIGYLVTVPTAFLYGYWGAFGVDFISYIKLSSVLSNSVGFDLPIFIGIAALMFMLATIPLGIPEEKTKAEKCLLILICLGYIPCIVITSGFRLATLLAVVCGLFVAAALHDRTSVKAWVADAKQRFGLLVVLGSLPFLAYGYGVTKAEAILTFSIQGDRGSWTFYVPIVDVHTKQKISTDVFLLGRIGDHHFTLDPVTKRRSAFPDSELVRIDYKNSRTNKVLEPTLEPVTHPAAQGSR